MNIGIVSEILGGIDEGKESFTPVELCGIEKDGVSPGYKYFLRQAVIIVLQWQLNLYPTLFQL